MEKKDLVDAQVQRGQYIFVKPVAEAWSLCTGEEVVVKGHAKDVSSGQRSTQKLFDYYLKGTQRGFNQECLHSQIALQKRPQLQGRYCMGIG